MMGDFEKFIDWTKTLSKPVFLNLKRAYDEYGGSDTVWVFRNYTLAETQWGQRIYVRDKGVTVVLPASYVPLVGSIETDLSLKALVDNGGLGFRIFFDNNYYSACFEMLGTGV